MSQRHWSVGLVLVLAAWGAGACSAILGIHDLVDPAVDASGDSAPRSDASADDASADGAADGSGDSTSNSDGAADALVDVGPAFNPNRASWRMPSPADGGVGTSSFFAASYDASTPGVVVDQVTGLMWQAVSDGQPRPWSDPDAATGTAASYCATLTLAGNNDWRVPSRIELVSLLDYTRSPAIDSTSFPGAPSGVFWSSTTLAGQPGKVQGVDFSTGNTFYQEVDVAPAKSGKVRCVRTPAPAPPAEYQRTIDTVADPNTKLTWQRSPAPAGPVSYADAVSYCAGLGWRLPTLKELQTIVDDGQFAPAIDQITFPGTLNAPDFWTGNIYNDPYVWTVNFKSGFAGAFASRTSDLNFVRCVN